MVFKGRRRSRRASGSALSKRSARSESVAATYRRRFAFEVLEERALLSVSQDLFDQVAPYQTALNNAINVMTSLPLVGDQLKDLEELNSILADSLSSIDSQVDELSSGHIQIVIPLPSIAETFTFDLGLDAFLQFSSSGGVAVAINPVLNLGFNYDLQNGDVDLVEEESNLDIGFNISLPNFQATLSFNGVLFTKAVDEGTNFAGNLKFGFEDNGTISPEFSGDANIRLGLSMSFVDPALGAAFNPRFFSSLEIDWGFNTSGDRLEAPEVALRNFSLDADSFLQGFMADIVTTARKYTQRIQPLIDIFETPVPILSAFDSDETVGDLFLRGAGVNGELKDRFDTFLRIVKTINTIEMGSTGGAVINFGDIDLAGDARATGAFSFDTSQIENVIGDIFTLPELDEVQEVVESVASYTGLVSTAGFKYPIYEDPGPVIGSILTGQPATMVSYDTGRLHFDLAASVGVGIPDLLGIFLTAGITFDAQLSFGYDTAGLIKFVNDPLKRPEDLLHGFYFDNSIDTAGPPIPNIPNPKKSAVYMQGFAGVEASAGVTVSGGLYANINIELASTDTSAHVHLDTMIQNLASGAQVFAVSGQVYAGAKVELTVPNPIGPDITLFEYELSRDVILDFNPPPPPHFAVPHTVIDVVNLHSVMLDPAKMTPGGRVTVQPFFNTTLGNTLTYSADGIRVDYPNEIVFYVMRKNDVTTNYYNFVGIDGATPDRVSIEVIDPFRVFEEEGVADPTPTQTTHGILLAGGKSAVYKYTDKPGGPDANVLLVGGYGSNTLSGGTMVFGNFIPADRIAQAKAHFGNVTGFEAATQSYLNSRIDSVLLPASPAGIIGATMTSRRGGLMYGGPGNNSFFAEGPGAYEMIGGSWTNTFTISPSFNGVPASYAIDGGPYGQSKLVVRVPGDENVSFENSAVADKYSPSFKALAITANAGLSATAHGIKKVQIIAKSGSSVTLGDTSELNTEFGVSGGAELTFGGTNAPDVFNVVVTGPFHGGRNHYPPLRYSSTGNTFGWGPGNWRWPDPIYSVTRTFGTNGRTQTIPFAVSDADASSLKLNAGGAADTYDLTLGLGAYIDVDVADTDQSSVNALAINLRDSVLYYQGLTVTDNSVEFDYYTQATYFSSTIDGHYLYFSSNHYTPTVSYSANSNLVVNSYQRFVNTSINRPTATNSMTLVTDGLFTTSNTTYGSVTGSVVDVSTQPFTNLYNPPLNQIEIVANHGPLTITDTVQAPRPLTTTITSNSGTLTFNGMRPWNGLVETFNILGNSGTLNLDAAVSYGFGLIFQTHVVNVRGNSGTINLTYVGISNLGLAGISLQVNVGANGSLAPVQGTLNIPGFGASVGLKLDNSAGPAGVWKIDQGITKVNNLTVNHVGTHGFDGKYEALTGANSQVDLYLDPSFFFRKINGVDFPSWGIYGDSQPFNFAGAVVSMPINVYGTLNGALTYSATNLPPGLSIHPTTGIITGTLTELAFVNSPYAAIVRATNGVFTRAFALDWHVNSGILLDFNGAGLIGRELAPLAAPPISATNLFNRPVTFSVTGLPPGLTFNPTTRQIVGSIALGAGQSGPYPVVVHATDGIQFTNYAFSLPVTGITLNTPPIAANHHGDNVIRTISASTASGAAVVFSAEGLPAGLSIHPTTGVITGTPTNLTDDLVTYPTIIRATQGTDVLTKSFSWTILPVGATNTIALYGPGNQYHVEGASGDSVGAYGSTSNTLFLMPLSLSVQGLPPGINFFYMNDFEYYGFTGSIPIGAATGSPYHVVLTATDGLTSTQLAFDWTITAAPHAMPGDFDGDDVVTLEDYIYWRANFGATTLPGLSADANGNGIVDAADYTIWRDNLGQSALATSSGGNGSGDGDDNGDSRTNTLDNAVQESIIGSTLPSGTGSATNELATSLIASTHESAVTVPKLSPSLDLALIGNVARSVAAPPKLSLSNRLAVASNDDALLAWLTASSAISDRPSNIGLVDQPHPVSDTSDSQDALEAVFDDWSLTTRRAALNSVLERVG
jgi:hypothetical protein